MRIAIYHNLPSGGAKRALFEMVRGLCANHEMDVYSLSCAEHTFCDLRPFARENRIFPFEPIPMRKSPFGRINPWLRVQNLHRLERIQQQIAQVIDRERYDLVFTHNCQFGQSPALLKYLQTPSVYYCSEPPRLLHEPRIPRPYLRSSYRSLLDRLDPLPKFYLHSLDRLDRQNAAAASLILVNSAFSRENVYRIYGLSARVNSPGVNCDHFRPLDLPRQNYVLSVGATHPGKGFDFLIQSLALIPQSQRPALMIVTNYIEPNEYAFLNRLAEEKGVVIEFRHLIPENQLVETYNQALLTVYSPILEPFGFAPLESMACGTAVVGVAEGGVRETIQDQVTGILCDRRPASFAQAVCDLLANPQKRAEMGQRGRETVVERWTWKHTVELQETYFSDLLDDLKQGAK